jgi:hypothetical protein
MKLGNKPVQGSFGLPEQLEQEVLRSQTKKEEPPKPIEPIATAEEQITQAGKSEVDLILKTLNITFTDEDFQKVVFKGSLEKEVDIIKGRLKATFRTLNTFEIQEVNELLMKEIKEIDMTKDGSDFRHALIHISYGVTHLQGNPLSSLYKNADGTPDYRRMAAERRKKFNEMSPAVINKIIWKHANFTKLLDLITDDPGEYLKN